MLGTATTLVRRIDRFEFSIWGNGLIKKYSVLTDEKQGVNHTEIEEQGVPRKGGINDMRMGTVSNQLLCAECGFGMDYCPTHIGHIELHKPVFHIGLLDHLKDVLNCVCIHCAKIRMKDRLEDLEAILRSREPVRSKFSKIKKISMGMKQCLKENGGCGSPYYKMSVMHNNKNGSISIVGKLEKKANKEATEESRKLDSVELNAEQVFMILKNITDEDYKLLGFDYRPEDLIIKTFLVSAKAIRPSNRGDYLVAGSVVEDKLTQRQLDIVKNNKRIEKYIEKETKFGDEPRDMSWFWNILQQHIALYADSESITASKNDMRSANKAEGIKQRIDSKEGRIRGNLMGKRTEYTGRSVVTSDPNIGIDEVGVPLFMAMTLTFPEVVTSSNYERLLRMVRNGRSKYPGANYVIPANKPNQRIDLQYRQQHLRLQYGDVVERHLVNGDLTLFNRQPSLHKASMMAHRVHVIPNKKYNSFRLNVSATTPYNADFDGDEMNMFIPRSIQTRVELEYLSAIPHQIISVRHSEPLIANKQDTVLALYLITFFDYDYDVDTFARIVVGIDQPKPFSFDKKSYRGADIISTILPPQLNMKAKYGNSDVLIENGQLRSGYFYGGVVKKLIIPTLYHNFGAKVTTQFINNTQKLAVKWLYYHGFTVGYGDNVINKELKEKIRLQIEMKKLEVDSMITKMENNPQMMDSEAFEESILSNLSSFLGTVSSQLMEHIDPLNNYYVMIESGSKGNKLNMGKINGVFGQNVLHNKRIPKNFNNRTLVHFAQHDDSALARGFIPNSFMDGMTSTDMFNGSRSGRDGCINTTVKTADTGYAMRKLVKALEDIGVMYDGTVRNSKGYCYQLLFGGSGLHQALQQSVRIHMLHANNAELRRRWCLSGEEEEETSKWNRGVNVSRWNEAQFEELRSLRDQLRRIQMSYSGNFMTLEEYYFLPFNIQQHLSDIVLNKSRRKRRDLDIETWQRGIERVLSFETLNTMYMRQKPNAIAMDDHQNMKLLFLMGILDMLSYKKCVFEHELSREEFEALVEVMIARYKRCVYSAGEQIGVQTAQSLGEPNTQLTLNTFHSAGTVNVGMQGVPRFVELIACRKQIKTPIMYLYFDKSVSTDVIRINRIGSFVTQIMFEELVDEVKIIYDASLKHHKRDRVDNPFMVLGQSNDMAKLPWLYRITLNKEQLLEKSVTMMDMKREFVLYMERMINNVRNIKREKEVLNNIIEMAILSTYDNSDQLVVHIRANINNVTDAKLFEFYNMMTNGAKGFKIKGVEGIKSIKYINKGVVEFDEKSGDVVDRKQYIGTTDGANLMDIRVLKNIVMNKSYTNDVVHFYRLYGIEAARNLLINQLRSLFSQEKVNVHHFELLVDKMTYFGYLTSIDRHGLNKPDVDILTRASFEEHTKQLIDASIYNEVDGNRAVSSRIMCGHVIRGGTGLCNVFLDEEMVMNSEQHDYADYSGFNEFNFSELMRSFN